MLRLLIVGVDKYGFLGRDFHPETSDEGLVVTAVKLDTQYTGKNGYVDEVVSEDGRLFNDAMSLIKANKMSDAEDNTFLFQMWTCVTADERILELMNHEVVRATEDTLAHIRAEQHNPHNCYHCGHDKGEL